MKIIKVDDLTPYLGDLHKVLITTVADGASIGFLPPVTSDTARDYWQTVAKEVKAGARIALLALDNQSLLGCVQLTLASKENARHRAEVEKLMVRPEARNAGIGRALMAAVEDTATQIGRSLIMLDTRTGDIAERLYSRMGYNLAGKVPNFVLEQDGQLYSTSIFYKDLTQD